MKFMSLLVIFLFSGVANATGLSDATTTVCDKVKLCGTAQLERQQLSPDLEAMLTLMVNGMCEAIVAPYVSQAINAGLEQKAVACLETLDAMSCDQLLDGGGNESKACQELEKAAEGVFPEEKALLEGKTS